MTNEQLTQKTMEQAEDIAKNKADIGELFHRVGALERASEEHGAIVASIHELALSVRDLSGKVKDVDGRLGVIEHDRRQKNHAVWQIAVSAILGGALTYLVTTILGGA